MDVFYQAEDTIITASEAGYLAPLNVAAMADLQRWRFRRAAFTRRQRDAWSLRLNPEALGKKPAPKDWTDYAESARRLDGLVATTNPGSSSATFAVIAALVPGVWAGKGGDILKGLQQSERRIVASMGVMGTKLQTGERRFFSLRTPPASRASRRRACRSSSRCRRRVRSRNSTLSRSARRPRTPLRPVSRGLGC
jgi:ABC-type Fe3+ transport system substrate-binding protein